MHDILKFFSGDNLEHLISWGGYAVLFAIVFAETGLLAGFFLPGDSLLFVAGFLVGSGKLKPPAPWPPGEAGGMLLLSLLLMIAAFAGNSTGYWIGSKAGPRLFNRPNSRFFKREHLLRTQEFYEKHGGKTIMLAEFMPFARTFAPVVAGIAQMPYRKFMSFNLAGVVIWINSMTVLGYWLGEKQWVRDNLDKAIILVVLLSLTPAIVHLLRERSQGRRKPVEEQGA
jgi:membrane-associated protein